MHLNKRLYSSVMVNAAFGYLSSYNNFFKGLHWLLSHPWFGAEEQLPAVPALRGLFVQYPCRQIRPALGDACERWESVTAGTGMGLLEPLARLVGSP